MDGRAVCTECGQEAWEHRAEWEVPNDRDRRGLDDGHFPGYRGLRLFCPQRVIDTAPL